MSRPSPDDSAFEPGRIAAALDEDYLKLTGPVDEEGRAGVLVGLSLLARSAAQAITELHDAGWRVPYPGEADDEADGIRRVTDESDEPRAQKGES